MNVFKNLFGQSKEPEHDNLQGVNKKSIHDFFKIDLDKIPDESFIEGIPQIGEDGDEFTIFRKNLNYKECEIFDTVEVLNSRLTDWTVVFKSYYWNRKIATIQKLIDELYLLYGEDDSGRGRFNDEDKNTITHKDYWLGRIWCDKTKHHEKVIVDFNNDEISLTVFGTKK
jgi:hypothetical protein